MKSSPSLTSIGKGKSRGARIITHLYVAYETVFLLSIYDKSDKENISDKELLKKISVVIMVQSEINLFPLGIIL